MRKKILFIIGSLNQTQQAHAVGQQLENEYECYYTHFYGDGLIRLAVELGIVNNTVLGRESHFYKQTAVYAHALIYTDGNVDEMIANCDVLITQYSTVVYTGIALGQEVYSYFDVEKLKKLSPWQNGGTSAQRIANVCRTVLEEGLAVARERFDYALA